MVRSYTAMGLPELARDALRVLQKNDPQNPDIPKLTTLVGTAPGKG